jgi:deoxyribodipyrimidine photo-lyase
MTVTQGKKALFIFRRDLRVEDNTGLLSALKYSQYVIPCFFLDPLLVKTTSNKKKNDNAIQFMIESLNDLDKQLRQKQSKLYLFFGKPQDLLKRLIVDEEIDSVHFNEDYTEFSRNRDDALAYICSKNNTKCFDYPDLLLINNPDLISKPHSARPYVVFAHFFNRAVELPVLKPQENNYKNYYSYSIHSEVKEKEKKGVYDSILSNPNSEIYAHGGRIECLKILKDIDSCKDYPREKDYPAKEQTTGLSAHNKFGTCSIREVYHTIKEKLGNDTPLLKQLYWRDFFTYIAHHYPHVFRHPFQRKYTKMKWKNDTNRFKLWCNGKTGFPIVDAGMRQLNTTGFMHNRVRLIVASFLTKDLHIDWKWGERYFAEKLVDYDPCVNNGNWQWAASTGCDAQPYVRIFNPWIQQKKFDPECHYIKKWLPELRNKHQRLIHQLSNNSEERYLEWNYPLPIVDHTRESNVSKDMYSSIKTIDNID